MASLFRGLFGGLFGRRKGGEEGPPEEESEEERIRRALKKDRSVVLGELPRYKARPQLIFVGSSKGGAGKSFLTANLAVAVSALSPSKNLYVVDLDLDNQTASLVLPPEGQMPRLANLAAKNNVNLLTVADVFEKSYVPRGWIIPRFRGQTFGCGGAQVDYSFLLIPAYDRVRMKEQQVIMRGLDTRSLRAGVDALLAYFQAKKNTDKSVVVLFDGKQKSDLGINVEPIYRQMAENSDAFILVTEPPYLNFDDLVAPYRGMMEKMVVVVNKVNPSVLDRVALLVRDALSYGVPAFAIPEVPPDGDLYRLRGRAPAADRLDRPTALHSMALAYFLNLVDDDGLRASGCDASVYAILSNYRKLFAQLGG